MYYTIQLYRLLAECLYTWLLYKSACTLSAVSYWHREKEKVFPGMAIVYRKVNANMTNWVYN